MTKPDPNEKFAESYVPETYGLFEPRHSGRYRMLSDASGAPTAVLWTNDVDAVGVLPMPGKGDAAAVLHRALSTLKKQGFDALNAYVAFSTLESYSAGDETEGKLAAAVELLGGAKPVTAAVEPPRSTELSPTTAAVFNAETEEFIDIILSDVNGVHVRDNGGWHPLPPGDDSYDGTEWISISEAGLTQCDKMLKVGRTPTREQMLKFEVSD